MATIPTKHVVFLLCLLIYGCVLCLRNSLQPLTNVFEKPPFSLRKDQMTDLFTIFYVGHAVLQIPAGLSLQIVSSEITLIVPVFLSGIWSQIQVHCESYHQCMFMRFLIGTSQASCFLSIMCLIQQYFSLKQFAFYSGLMLLTGNVATSFNFLQTHLLVRYQIYKAPLLILSLCMQGLCILLLITYGLERKRIINEIRKNRNGKKELISDVETTETAENSEISKSIKSKQTTSWKLWFIPRDQLMELRKCSFSKSMIDTEDDVDSECSKITITSNESGDDGVDGVNGVDTMDPARSTPSFRKRAVSALSNRYTYLFAAIYGLLCITPILLGSMWLKTYLTTKWPKHEGKSGDTKNDQLIITENDAQIINIMTFIGAGIGSILFGWISRRYQDRNPFIHRQLCCSGFLLQATILMVFYLPASFYAHWGLLINAFIHGMGMGTIAILFAGTRSANDATQSSDVASAIVGTIGVGPISLSGFIFGKILVAAQGSGIPKDTKLTESEFNQAFFFVVAVICTGFVMALFIPKIKRK